ncbi:hypothetical protein D8674_006166 [Pyrus ussuriensis x Pyrus communis]|uniref:MBD domain-containing protein n=1 Tax=Pyrus ussuriensis x Pyrus communis TaxID=2448454 RepID=A0A5N5FTM9_9ROSA|nr:hypothetical protein D8674_006166 [Pyrus ussuriensis x Pyrus communis]
MKQEFGSLPAQKEEQAEGDGVLCAVSYDAVPLQAVPAPQLLVKFVPGENYGLPEGWAVEEKPRTTVKGRSRKDKFCHHIPTGKRFRSLSDAKKWTKEETTGGQAHGTSKDGHEIVFTYLNDFDVIARCHLLHRVLNPRKIVLQEEGEKQLRFPII